MQCRRRLFGLLTIGIIITIIRLDSHASRFRQGHPEAYGNSTFRNGRRRTDSCAQGVGEPLAVLYVHVPLWPLWLRSIGVVSRSPGTSLCCCSDPNETLLYEYETCKPLVSIVAKHADRDNVVIELALLVLANLVKNGTNLITAHLSSAADNSLTLARRRVSYSSRCAPWCLAPDRVDGGPSGAKHPSACTAASNEHGVEWCVARGVAMAFTSQPTLTHHVHR